MAQFTKLTLPDPEARLEFESGQWQFYQAIIYENCKGKPEIGKKWPGIVPFSE